MDKFTKVEQVSLGDVVLKQFMDLIDSGTYKAGDRLPCERDLCLALNVSRPVLREVLSVLRHLGILETIQGGGTFVRNQPLLPAVNSIRFALAVEKAKALEIWEVRNTLETELAGFAAERGGDVELQCVREAFERYENLVKEGATQDLINEASCKFHNAIANAAHNDTMSYLLDGVSSLLTESREMTGRVEGSNERSVSEHRAITIAICNRDVQEAKRCMVAHMQSVRKDLNIYLERLSKEM